MVAESTPTLRKICKEHRINEIFLDLDDVLNKFVGSLGLWYYRNSQGPDDLSWWDYDTGYSILGQLKRLSRNGAVWGYQTARVVEAESLEALIPEFMWKFAPSTEYLNRLVNVCCELVGPSRLHIATKPLNQVSCYSGKKEWVSYFLPRFGGNIHITDSKEHLSAPGRLLIDDTLHNCTAWDSYGGTSLNVPKPWNRRGYQNGDDHKFFTELLAV